MRFCRWSNRQVRALNASLSLEICDGTFDLGDVLDTVPEKALSGAGETPVRPLEVPYTVLVIGKGGPEELAVVPLHSIEHVINDVVENTIAGRKELSEDGYFALGVADDRDAVEWLVAVDRVWSLLKVREDSRHAIVAVLHIEVAVVDDLSDAIRTDFVDRLRLEELIATPDERTRARVGEELLVEHTGGDDGNARGAREVVEEFLDFTYLELGTVLHPGLLHQTGVLLIEVNHVELLTRSAVEETALFVKEDDLQGFKLFGKLTSRNIGIYIENLAIYALCETSKDGKSAGTDGSLERALVDARNFSNKAIFVTVEVLCSENARCDWTCACAKFLEGINEFQVFFKENAASNIKSVSISDADAVDVVGSNTFALDDLIELRTRAMENDGVETDTGKEGKRVSDFVKLIKYSSSDFDDGEFCGVRRVRRRRENAEVSLHLTLGSN